MTTDGLFSSLSFIVIAHAGAMILCVLVPFTVALVLLGVIALLRGKGPNPLIFTALLACGLTVLGDVLRQHGLDAMVDSIPSVANVETLRRNESFFLVFSLPLSLLGFIIKAVQMLMSEK